MILTSSDIVKLIEKFIDEGYKNFKSLPDNDQLELTVLAMNTEKYPSYMPIMKYHDSTLHALKKFMLSNDACDALNLSRLMSENAMNYFKEELEKLFIHVLNDRDYEEKIEAGLTPHYSDGVLEFWTK